MTKPQTIASLFEKKPARWGLRGDPYLWEEMKSHFENTPLPATTDELVSLIQTAFASLTAHSVSESENFFIERLSHGGMSSGHISPEFWRDKVIPEIGSRFDKL